MIKKYLGITAFIIITLASQAFCDTIYLKNGKFVKGTITRQTRASVTIQTETGQIRIRRVNITKVNLSKAAGAGKALSVPAGADPLAGPDENDPLAAPAEIAAAPAPAESAVMRKPLASNFGIELSGAYWSLSDDTFKDLKSDSDSECAGDGAQCDNKSGQGSMGAGAALFWETGSDIRFGVSLGYNILPSGEYKEVYTLTVPPWASEGTWENSAYSVPVALYAKIRQSEKINLFGGIGADYIKAKVQYKFHGPPLTKLLPAANWRRESQ